MNIKQRIKDTTTKQWIRFGGLSAFWVFFSFWAGNPLLLLLIFLFLDIYVTRFIPWSFWKKSNNKVFKYIMDWVDAILFALVAVYFIFTFFFQNYQIPTSSLEKSLLVGDFLFVSKLSYGPRAPITPLSFPLAQHTMPVIGGKSYIEKPQWKYKRLKGVGHVKRNDIVVFNFPAGDTVATNRQATDYYTLCALNPKGSAGIKQNKREYGDVVYRPVDRRENYVKRCVALPGETFEIRNDSIFIDEVFVPSPETVQYAYYIQTDGTFISEKLFEELGLSRDDYGYSSQDGRFHANILDLRGVDSTNVANNTAGLKLTQKDGSFGCLYYSIFLTPSAKKSLESKPFVLNILKEIEPEGDSFYYPLNYKKNWTRCNYGPLWMPKQGETITFDTDIEYKAAAYERCIKNYEGNDFQFKNGKIYINGEVADSYTFKMDYYFMMGDNRDNSADSRMWGFVPEDHVVGQPLLIWLSLNKDKGWFNGKIRWNRLFSSAKK